MTYSTAIQTKVSTRNSTDAIGLLRVMTISADTNAINAVMMKRIISMELIIYVKIVFSENKQTSVIVALKVSSRNIDHTGIETTE